MYRSSVFILLAWSAFAQVDAGVISGSVYDGSGAVLANTDVQIIDEASNGKAHSENQRLGILFRAVLPDRPIFRVDL